MNQPNTNQPNTNERNTIERMNRDVEIKKISYFIRGMNTSTTIIFVVYATSLILWSVVSPNYTGDDVRNEIFKSVDFETYKNIDEYKECFPKNGCMDTGICYSSNTNNSNTNNICDFQLHKTCECANMNCTINDWNTVNIKSCHMISSGDIATSIITIICIVPSISVYFLLIDRMLYNITAKRIIHFRYFIMVCLLQIFNMWIFTTTYDDNSNIKGIYWIGIIKLWFMWIIQNLVLIWPRIMDKTTKPSATKYYPRMNQPVEPIQSINQHTQNIVIEQIGETEPNLDGTGNEDTHSVVQETIYANEDYEDNIGQPQETTATNIIGNIVQPVNLIQVIHNSSSIHEDTVTIDEESSRSFTQQLTEHETTADNLCLICCSHKREILLLPCCHVCYCQECGNSRRITNCPYCRTNINYTLKIFIP
jgi:hypothetical protein